MNVFGFGYQTGTKPAAFTWRLFFTNHQLLIMFEAGERPIFFKTALCYYKSAKLFSNNIDSNVSKNWWVFPYFQWPATEKNHENRRQMDNIYPINISNTIKKRQILCQSRSSLERRHLHFLTIVIHEECPLWKLTAGL